MPTTEDFKVKLVSAVDRSMFANNKDKYADKVVVFDVTPAISETGSVEYESISILHGPTSFPMYKGTPARTFSMSDIKIVSRTPTEARNNIQKVNQLRAWRMPYFGDPNEIKQEDVNSYFSQVQSGGAVHLDPFTRLTASSKTLLERLGAPPEVLYFSAYSNSGSSTNASTMYRGNINSVPVVITNLDIQYPNDSTYITTAKRGQIDALGNVPFPVILTISISLLEAHSPYEVNKFNLSKYENGILDNF